MSPRVAIALEQIKLSRQYTTNQLNDLGHDDWFWVPPNMATHIAWQVGHLAMAQYWLGLARIRGLRPSDEALISHEFLQQFGKGSTPDADATKYPPIGEIRATYDRVYEQVLVEVPKMPDSQCDEESFKPHQHFRTKLGSLQWCSLHEMTHAGQIGMLRRMMGKPWQW